MVMMSKNELLEKYRVSKGGVEEALGDFASVYEEQCNKERIRILVVRIVSEMRKNLNHVMAILDRLVLDHPNSNKKHRTGFNAYDIKPENRGNGKYNHLQLAFLDHLYSKTKTTVSSSQKEICDAALVRSRHLDTILDALRNSKKISLIENQPDRVIVHYSPFDQLDLPSKKLQSENREALIKYFDKHRGSVADYLIQITTDARNTEEHEYPVPVVVDELPYVSISTTDDPIWLIRVDSGGALTLKNSFLCIDATPSNYQYPHYIKSVLRFSGDDIHKGYGFKNKILPNSHITVQKKGKLSLDYTAISSDSKVGLLISPSASIISHNSYVKINGKFNLLDGVNVIKCNDNLFTTRKITLYKPNLAGMNTDEIISNTRGILNAAADFMNSI
jgi:hypothetical protein